MLDTVQVPVPAAADAPDHWSLFGAHLSELVIAAAGAASGGDWCEAFPVSSGVIALSIGDVCGHGDRKLETRMAIRERIRGAARRGLDPAQTLVAAHHFLRTYDPDDYATAIFGLLNLEKRTFVFANAGHPAPLLCAASGTTYLEYQDTDLPLGILGAAPPPLRRADVPESALLVLYTDGVTEHDRKPLQGAAKLRAAAGFAYTVPSSPATGVIKHEMGLLDINHDDVAILTARMPHSPRRTASIGR